MSTNSTYRGMVVLENSGIDEGYATVLTSVIQYIHKGFTHKVQSIVLESNDSNTK